MERSGKVTSMGEARSCYHEIGVHMGIFGFKCQKCSLLSSSFEEKTRQLPEKDRKIDYRQNTR